MRGPRTFPHSQTFGKREQTVGLLRVHFRLQEFAALTVFCDHHPRVPSVAGRAECPSALFDRSNRRVLRHFPARAVGIDPADMMNSVVRAGSLGFIDTMDSNLAHGSGERLFES